MVSSNIREGIKMNQENDEKKDMLKNIFEEQNRLNNYLDEKRNIKRDNDPEWVLNYVIAMNEELAEVQRNLPWKWWKNEEELDRDETLEELVDLLHFWVSAVQQLGFDSEDVYKAYMDKNQENQDRQTRNGEYHAGE